MVLDYSRWDNLEVSSEEEDEIRGNEPVVHRVDEAEDGELRFGNVTVKSKRKEGKEDVALPSTSASASAKTEIDAEDTLKRLSRNGAKYEKYFWSQDQQSCMVSVIVPKGSRAKDVLVDLSKFDTKAGTKCAKHLRIEHKPSNTVVQGDLSYFCRAEEDDLISHWEVKDLNKEERVIQVQLTKWQVADNVVMWWKKLFVHEPELDPKAMEDRKGKEKQSFAEVWNSAEEMFKQKVRSKDKININVNQ